MTTGAKTEIIRRIKKNGPMTFKEFMETALYWPEGGYYTGVERWGPEGDYYTSVDVSPIFARSIAKQIVEMRELLWDGGDGEFTLIEDGAGRGLLSMGILDSVKTLCPALHSSIRIMLIEKNPHLRKPRRGHNPPDGRGGITPRVTWHAGISEIPPGVTGCILTNELIDSFPVHRVICAGGELYEVYVDWNGGEFAEIIGGLSLPALSKYLDALNVTLEPGQRAEINLAAIEWFKDAASVLDRGFVVTIDYGLPGRELYGPERKNGSLHCHYKHTLNDDPFLNIGEQDITTLVDFTSVARAGETAGLHLTGFTTQKNFLLGSGILDEMEESNAKAGGSGGNLETLKLSQEIKRLIMPGAMGDTFKALIQHKGILKPSLRCLSFRDMSVLLL